MLRLPNELLIQVFGDCVSGANPSEYLHLRLVNRCVHDQVTRPLLGHWLSHITVEGRDLHFRYPWVLNERTHPAVKHLTVQVEPAETEEEQAGQPGEHATMLHRLLKSCENIRSVDVVFNKLPLVTHHELVHKDWDPTYGDINVFPKLRDELQDRILDQTAALSGRLFKEENGRRNIRVNFRNLPETLSPTWYEHALGLAACAGRNPGMILVQDYIDRLNGEGWVLENTATGHASGVAPPGPPGWPATTSDWVAREVSHIMGHIVNLLGDLLPGCGPDLWGFLAKQTAYHRHLLIGASTALTRDLNVPDSIREPFNAAASELGRAAELFGGHAEQAVVDRARVHLSQACTLLEDAAEVMIADRYNTAADPPQTDNEDDFWYDSNNEDDFWYDSNNEDGDPWHNDNGDGSGHW